MVYLNNDYLKVEISKYGAELKKIHDIRKDIDYLWSGDAKYWKRTAPHLFPIVGKLKNDEFTIDNKIYKLPQHGFARDMEFETIESTNDYACFKLKYNQETLLKYPYKFEFYTEYILSKNTITVRWLVKNIDNQDIYFSIGAHPAFNIIPNDKGNYNDYCISLIKNRAEQSHCYKLSNSLIDSSTELSETAFFLKPKLFEEDALIFSNIDRIKLRNLRLNTSIEVDLTDFPFVGIWSPYNHENNSIAPFICIEPWYGIADTKEHNGDFKNKLAINKLSEKEFFLKSYSIKFK